MFEDLLAEEPARLVEFEDRPGLLGALARTQPGAHVMQVLVLIDPLGLSADERVDYLLAWERCSGWTAAQQARAFAAMGRPCPGEEPGALAELRAEEDWVREESQRRCGCLRPRRTGGCRRPGPWTPGWGRRGRRWRGERSPICTR